MKYYCVTSTYDDRGHVTAHITNEIESDEKPENSFHETPKKDIYHDWFNDQVRAFEFIRATLTA